MPFDPSFLIALIAAFGGLGAWAAFRKSGPESESITVKTLRGVIAELRTEVERLRGEVEGLRSENQKLFQVLGTGGYHRFQEVLDTLPVAIYEAQMGPAGEWYYVSSEVRRLTGWAPACWTKDPAFWLTVIHPDDAARVKQEDATLEMRAVPGTRASSDYRIVAPDGTSVEIHDEAVLARRGNGELVWRGALLPA